MAKIKQILKQFQSNFNIDADNKLLHDKFCFDWKKNWILKKFNLLINFTWLCLQVK